MAVSPNGASPPLLDDVLTMCPSSPFASMIGTNARMPLMTPQTLTPMHHAQSFISCSQIQPSPPEPTPALLHSTCTVPYASTAFAANSSTDDGSETSVRTPMTS